MKHFLSLLAFAITFSAFAQVEGPGDSDDAIDIFLRDGGTAAHLARL